VVRLRRYIEQQKLEPGMRLPAERQLAAELGVSRSSLREALQQLISSGLLISRRGGGTWLRQQLAPWAEQRIVTPVRALLRYLEEEKPEEYVSRTPQIEALLDMFDDLDALEEVEEEDDEDSLPDDVLRLVKQKKITALAAAQSLIPELSERIREHLMRYPELMTPELLEDFFPELLEAMERPKH